MKYIFVVLQDDRTPLSLIEPNFNFEQIKTKSRSSSSFKSSNILARVQLKYHRARVLLCSFTLLSSITTKQSSNHSQNIKAQLSGSTMVNQINTELGNQFRFQHALSHDTLLQAAHCVAASCPNKIELFDHKTQRATNIELLIRDDTTDCCRGSTHHHQPYLDYL